MNEAVLKEISKLLPFIVINSVTYNHTSQKFL